MLWFAQFPDLKPSENIWMMVKRQIDSNIFQYSKDLMTLLEKEWIAIPIQSINKLTALMANRYQEFMKNKGLDSNFNYLSVANALSSSILSLFAKIVI